MCIRDSSWIREVSSKSVKHSIESACTAFLRFFNHQSGFPKYKKKGRSDVKMYFVRNSPTDCLCERHRIKIPTLGWVKLKEKGYIPTSKDGYVVRSGAVSMKAGRYYVSALVEIPDTVPDGNLNEMCIRDRGVLVSIGNLFAFLFCYGIYQFAMSLGLTNSCGKLYYILCLLYTSRCV